MAGNGWKRLERANNSAMLGPVLKMPKNQIDGHITVLTVSCCVYYSLCCTKYFNAIKKYKFFFTQQSFNEKIKTILCGLTVKSIFGGLRTDQ